MTAIEFTRKRIATALAWAALAATPLLSACSDRDTTLSESVAAAQNAATRAEQAAKRAEDAASSARAASASDATPDVAVDEPAEEAADPGEPDQAAAGT